MTALPPQIAEEHAACEADDIIKWGTTTDGNQRYRCKSTGDTWTDNGAEPGRRIPAEPVGAALSLFFDGLSLRDVRRNFGPIFEFQPSSSTVYEWIRDYTDLAQIHLRKAKPTKLGDTWVADEMVVRMGGKKLWIWTVMDAETRFILAQRISRTRDHAQAGALFREALRRADGDKPKKVITDGLSTYPGAIRDVLGRNVRHVVTGSIADDPNNNLIERLNGTIRERTKVMRGWDSRETGIELLEGWRIHYNYFRPHESLDDKTPAQAAGAKTDLKNWEDVAEEDVRLVSKIRAERQREKKGAPEMVAESKARQLRLGPKPQTGLKPELSRREPGEITGIGRRTVRLTRGDEAEKGFGTRKPSPFPKRRRGVFKRNRLVK